MRSRIDPPAIRRELRQQFRETLGLRLRKLRRDAGFTHEQVAAWVGIMRYEMVRIEMGMDEPSVWLLRDLAAAYGLTIDDLIRGIGVPS